MNALTLLVIEYTVGAVFMLVRICISRPWSIVGWSRRKRFWVGVWETTVNVVLWPIPCAQVLWKELV